MPSTKFVDPKNDIAFKKIFGSEQNKSIVIHFINDILDFSDIDKIRDVTFIKTTLETEIAYKKQSILDVLCTSHNGTQIIVEMQVAPSRGFEKRAQYYAAKAYSQQLSQGQKPGGLYVNLKAMIFIAIWDYTIFANKPHYISHHILLDKKTYDHDLKDFSFTFIELPKFRIKKIDELKTIVEKWCYFFKLAAVTTEDQIAKIVGKDSIVGLAFQALNRFKWTPIELRAYEEEVKRNEDNLASEYYIKESTAKKLKMRGIETGIISSTTGLSEPAVEQLEPEPEAEQLESEPEAEQLE